MMDKGLLNAGVYHKDVVEMAKTLYTYIPSSGAYAESQGIRQVRETCAKFIEKRDGFPSNPSHIFLSNGASDSIKNLISCLIRDQKDGIMISVPRYPLYSADIVLKGGAIIPYYLNEETKWSLDMPDLEKNHSEALAKGINPRAIVVINPGNPTGAILSKQNIEDVIKFCYTKRLVLIADEVYQHNVFDETIPFHSFKKVLYLFGFLKFFI
jgi:aspartate/methionine/tyrosine aminotransferase